MLKKNILIIDDNAEDRQLIKDAINECVVPVQIADLTEGTLVINYLLNCSTDLLPGLILVDLNMPGMNGYDVIGAIRKYSQFNSIPIYIFTDSHSVQEKIQCLQLGATDVLNKPLKFNEWVSILCPLIDNRQPIRTFLSSLHPGMITSLPTFIPRLG